MLIEKEIYENDIYIYIRIIQIIIQYDIMMIIYLQTWLPRWIRPKMIDHY